MSQIFYEAALAFEAPLSQGGARSARLWQVRCRTKPTMLGGLRRSLVSGVSQIPLTKVPHLLTRIRRCSSSPWRCYDARPGDAAAGRSSQLAACRRLGEGQGDKRETHRRRWQCRRRRSSRRSTCRWCAAQVRYARPSSHAESGGHPDHRRGPDPGGSFAHQGRRGEGRIREPYACG